MLKKFNTSLNPGPERWELLSKVHDFKREIVADVGCWNGYFAMEINKVAACVHCYDSTPVAFELPVVRFNIETDALPHHYDTILFLDTLQYVKNQEQALTKLFLGADCFILEIFFNQVQPHWHMISKELVLELAKICGHKLKTEYELERGSTVMLFEKC